MTKLSKNRMRSGAWLAILTSLSVLSAPVARADFDGPPKPKIDCSKKANKNKPQCQKHYDEMSDDEIYNASYWLAREGHYQDALSLLSYAHDPSDKRILTATGFATRKLGNVDAAFPYYARALAIDPNYTLARSYLGDAYLSKGNLAAARHELDEIATRCGPTCDGYAQLSERIARFETVRQQGG